VTITLSLSPEIERKLSDRAARSGRDVESLARELLERGINSEPTLDEILAPFRRAVTESGVSDEELTALFEEARDEVHRAREGTGQ
jgi:plasmid stability protein